MQAKIMRISPTPETRMDRALRDKGLANRKKVLGDAYVEKSMASADGFNPSSFRRF